MTYHPIERGVICPTITPLKATGDINPDMIRQLADFLIDRGVAGTYPLGSTDEGPLVTAAERKAAAGREPILDRPRHPYSSCETDLAFDSAIALTIRNRTGSALRLRVLVQ